MVTDENFASEADRAEIEEALTGPKLWCGVFAGQLAKIELTVQTHPDLSREARDRIAIRMREVVRELAVEAGAREPDQPLVGADGLGGEETYSEGQPMIGPDGVPGPQDRTEIPDGDPVPDRGNELHDSHAVGEPEESERTEETGA